MSKVAWIGLGTMGYPIAGHLKARGKHDVTVFNRTRAKAETWVEQFGGSLAASPAEAVDRSEFVFTCVGNDDDLRAVTLASDGAFRSLGKGAIFVDHPLRRPPSRASFTKQRAHEAPEHSTLRCRAGSLAQRAER